MLAIRIKPLCTLIAGIALLSKGTALTLNMPSGEIARLPSAQTVGARVEFNNDSYSLFPGDDWDDFRTFGAYFGLASRNWFLDFTAVSFTARNTSERTASRVDELHGQVSRRVFSLSRTLGSGTEALAEARLGAGALALGNFNSEVLQNGVHSGYGCIRESPGSDNTPDARYIGMGNAALMLALDTPFVPLFSATTVEAGHTGFWRVSSFSGVDYRAGFIEARLYGGFVRAGGYGDIGGDAFSLTLDSENGWYAGTTIRAGPLETGFSWNASENRQAGYAALVFGLPEDKDEGDRDSTAKDSRTDDAHARSVDVRVYPLYAGVRLRQSLVELPITVSAAFGAEGGPMTIYEKTVYDTEHYRYQQAYLALEASRTAFKIVEFYALAGAGWREETLKTAVLTRAELIDKASSPVFVGEGGLRLYLPRKTMGERDWGIGVSGLVNYSRALVPGWCPMALVYITASEGRKNTWRD